MRKIVVIFIIALFLPIPRPGWSGVYNTFSGLIWCKPEACPHEVGHKLDDLSGWISDDEEFVDTVNKMGLDFQLSTIGEKETYAELFAMADGKEEKMPEQLREFYNWELAEVLMEKYNGR